MLVDKSANSIEGVNPQSIPITVLNAQQPLILKGLIAGWRLVQKGLQSKQDALEYINQFYTGEQISAFLSKPNNKGRLFYNEQIDGFNFKPIKVNFYNTFNELFRHQHRNQSQTTDNKTHTCYMGSTSIDHWFPGFRQHNDIELTQQKPSVNIWIGNQTRIAAHNDIPNNIACCAVGNRRFTLFPPDQKDNLYIGPSDITPAGRAISLVDFNAPDYQKFPKFKAALDQAQIAYLEPGDALFIPSQWWHHVEALSDFNVLVNYWWNRQPSSEQN